MSDPSLPFLTETDSSAGTLFAEMPAVAPPLPASIDGPAFNPRLRAGPPRGPGYAQHKRRMIERSSAQVLAGQDIGRLPPIANPGRRALSDADFGYFAREHFPLVFYLPWSKDHLRAIAKIERAVIAGETFALAMPRGSGKTSLCEAAALWAILTGRHPFVMLIGATVDKASEATASLKAQLLTNDLLMEDYPEACYPIRCLENQSKRSLGQRYMGRRTQIGWSLDEVVMPSIPESRCSGALVRMASIMGNIRGARFTRPDGSTVRPTLCIVDDPQTDESARSASQVAERLNILNGAIAGLSGPGRKLARLLPGSVIAPGDLMEQLLDREHHPEWQGERTQMVYKFPEPKSDCDNKWRVYAEMRADSYRRGGLGEEATEFYRVNRPVMDSGYEVAWPQRHTPSELSGVQHAVNLRLQDERAFWAEYQNAPKAEDQASLVCPPGAILKRLNGYDRAQVPKAAACLTAFIDVQQACLYWLVAAWTGGFTGFVVDYGTWPKQSARYFTLRDVQQTLQAQYPGAGNAGAIMAGLKELVAGLTHQEFAVAGGGKAKIERLLIDSGYLSGVVGTVSRQAGGSVMPSKGLGLKAGNRPMSMYTRKTGEKHGHHWYVPNVGRTMETRHVLIDTNYWKTRIHAGFAAALGDPGSLSLWGSDPATHQMFADQLGASESVARTEGYGRVVYEWRLRPDKPDNHLFDCLVGAACAASICGCLVGDENRGVGPVKRPKPRAAAQVVDMSFRPELG